jgi:hypothetical protein
MLKHNNDSKIKARYALAVLKIAQSADRETAARLISGLARDFPHPDERRDVAALHFDAIEAFEQLAESLRSPAAPTTWGPASSTTSKWLSAVEAN